ncbi:FAD-binding domain-containing protein [Melanogaster broomeanus]|nr:FAD-binding domain-containing protein [Melanogaster broomeanus]
MLLGQLVTTVLLTSVVSGCMGLMESTGANKLLTLSTCKKIEAYTSSASEIFYDRHPSYHRGIEHWASSSSQRAMCVFEPGSAEDVAISLQILGETRTPFAVKGGGHATNPGFSSTLGVHISMTRFSDVTYNSSARTATVGAGMVWDDVYAALAQHGVVVVGGRVSGVGVAGFTLGGGYSWLTEQYGLAVDNVEEYELVMPNGTIIAVTESSSPELFFGLKGGFNNFGIVTKFTLGTFPQSLVWGGLLLMDGAVFGRLVAATQDFLENNIDTKAAVIVNYNILAGSKVAFVILFYDGPEPPKGLFDDFMNIEAYQDVRTRSYLSLVQASPISLSSGRRGTFHTIPIIKYPRGFQEVIIDELWASASPTATNLLSLTPTSPFPYMFLHKLDSATSSISRGAFSLPSAWGTGVHPVLMYAAWEDPTMDEQMYDAVRAIMETLKEKLAVATAGQVNTLVVQDPDGDGATSMPTLIPPPELYGNYAMVGTPVEDIYGDHLPRLRKLREEVDPKNVMRLAGGWKF